MHLNYMAFAIPFFLLFIALEYYFSKKQNKQVYHFNETIANLNVGIVERLSDMLTTGSFFFLFSWINKHVAFFDIPSSPLTWLILFLLTDLVWYWYHRFGHTINLFWSVHVVHHQSDDFNYTVSARITILQAVARGLFWCILPLIGFKAGMITTLLLIHGAYPFFTHTQLVGKLGWLEYLFVTPSHHRVHHSSNEEYLDKNYGDVLIIWDKLFGTFAEEKSNPVYGLTAPLNSHSFLWQHFHFILEMFVAFKLAKGFRKKLQVIFGKPDNIDPRIRIYLAKKLSRKNEILLPTTRLVKLIRLQTISTLIILFFSILYSNYLSAYELVVVTAFIILSVITTGAMLEQRTWIFPLEFIRLTLTGMFFCDLLPSVLMDATVVSMLAIVLLSYKTLHQQYYSLIYYSTGVLIKQDYR